ncbi:PREDICTED: protein toll [Polistes canadensis]|uniref:protein toll n=1 Tax=Polistes canadensis TaxID=91411 RepID=UPI00071904EB|nr:PREDICTED: protein toll [Polistes canadensis]
MIFIIWGIISLFTLSRTYISAFECKGDQNCTCQPNYSSGIEIFCQAENNSEFILNIYPQDFLQITCQNWKGWEKFRFTSTLPGKELDSLRFRICGLSKNISLGDVARQMGVESVNTLLFQSYSNLGDELTRDQVRGFPKTKKLILSSNGFSKVPKDLLMDFPELEWLDLRENNLQLPVGIFDATPNLKVLELGNNGMKTIKTGTFDKLEKLHFLNIWDNRLTEIETGLFDKLISLRSLDLSMNKLMILSPNVFSQLNKLETVNLSSNNFSSLPEGLFDHNVFLRKVKLSNNRRNLTTLPDHLFANLTKLEIVSLTNNGLKVLPENLFWGGQSLKNISLDRNFFYTLPKDIFKGLTNVEKVQLSFNHIEALPDRIFYNMNKLTKLDLSNNRMVSISPYLFDGLKSLTELNMENNQLKTIDQLAFSSVRNLRIAKFCHNKLTFNLYGIQEDYQSPFNKCYLLNELYLSNNYISTISNDWSLNAMNLHVLDLSYNDISVISMDDLQFVSNNIKVNLTNNKIKYILLAESIRIYQETPRDVIIYVEHNPLICDCNLYNFLRYLEGRMHPKVQNYFHIIPGNLTCLESNGTSEIEISKLSSKTLKCAETEYLQIKSKCPTGCTCRIQPEDKARLIDCSNKNLSQLLIDTTGISDKKPVDGYHIKLNISGNNFTEIPSTELLGSEYVTDFILSNNNITRITLDKLPKNLEVLELHNNNISRIDSNLLDYWKNSITLKRLTLHKNPWKCDCDARDLFSFVQSKLIDIPDLGKVMCNNMAISMLEMSINDFCPFETMMIIGISFTIALLCLFIGGLVALYYRYQQEIKVWLYAHQCCLWLVTEDELDKEKIYDAFISYSHKDEDFVVKELVPKLESGPRPYKLCLHYRDWLAGEWIPTQITRSVEKSKRTIVIVSPNFLESIWGAMEFRAAHRQAMSEGRARVILILYGDIGSTDNLDVEFKAYLNMNTYVKWGDPWFWDKLRYALPHPPELTKSLVKKKIFEKHYPCIQINGEKKELIYSCGIPDTPIATTPPADSLKMFICDSIEKFPRVNSDENEVTKLSDSNIPYNVPECEAIHKNLINKIQSTTTV